MFKSKFLLLSTSAFVLGVSFSLTPLNAMESNDENPNKRSSQRSENLPKRLKQEVQEASQNTLSLEERVQKYPLTPEGNEKLKSNARKGDEAARDEMLKRAAQLVLNLDPASDLKDFFDWPELKQRILTKQGYAGVLFIHFKDQYAEKLPHIVDEIKTSAERDKNPMAQYNLGVMYQQGRGVAQSDQEAVKYYEMAAKQDHAPAQYNLGMMYKAGTGVAQSDQEAVRLYTLAAGQGHAGAQNNLGAMYQAGKDVAQDYQEAVKYFRMAVDQGYATAQYNLGVMYQQGRGVAQSDQEAVRLYTLAVRQGYVPAQNNLGRMYATGRGVEKTMERP